MMRALSAGSISAVLPGKSQASSDRSRHDRIVAGQHDRIPDAHPVQLCDHRSAFRPDLVGIGHKPGDSAVDRDIKTGIAALIERGTVGGGRARC